MIFDGDRVANISTLNRFVNRWQANRVRGVTLLSTYSVSDKVVLDIIDQSAVVLERCCANGGAPCSPSAIKKAACLCYHIAAFRPLRQLDSQKIEDECIINAALAWSSVSVYLANASFTISSKTYVPNQFIRFPSKHFGADFIMLLAKIATTQRITVTVDSLSLILESLLYSACPIIKGSIDDKLSADLNRIRPGLASIFAQLNVLRTDA